MIKGKIKEAGWGGGGGRGGEAVRVKREKCNEESVDSRERAERSFLSFCFYRQNKENLRAKICEERRKEQKKKKWKTLKNKTQTEKRWQHFKRFSRKWPFNLTYILISSHARPGDMKYFLMIHKVAISDKSTKNAFPVRVCVSEEMQAFGCTNVCFINNLNV